MQHSDLAFAQISWIEGLDGADVPVSVPVRHDTALMERPLTEAKRLAAAEFERRYLIRVMGRAGGSVSGGARLSGLDRTNFRRLLQRHRLHATALSKTVGP